MIQTSNTFLSNLTYIKSNIFVDASSLKYLKNIIFLFIFMTEYNTYDNVNLNINLLISTPASWKATFSGAKG